MHHSMQIIVTLMFPTSPCMLKRDIDKTLIKTTSSTEYVYTRNILRGKKQYACKIYIVYVRYQMHIHFTKVLTVYAVMHINKYLMFTRVFIYAIYSICLSYKSD